MLTWAGLVQIAFAELTNDTLKKDIVPLGPMTWVQRMVTHDAPSPAYNVNRTAPRGFGENQRIVSQLSSPCWPVCQRSDWRLRCRGAHLSRSCCSVSLLHCAGVQYNWLTVVLPPSADGRE